MIRSLLGALPFTRPLVRELAFRRAAAMVREAGASLERSHGALRLTRDARTIVLAEGHLPFAPEIATDFEGYFGATAAAAEPAVRDFSRPALHRVPALDGDFWLCAPIESVEVLRAYMAPFAPLTGAVVFDLGANCGLSTVLLARAVGAGGQVHAWEPDPTNREMLTRNVAAHAAAVVRVHAEAIAGTVGTRAFNAESSLGAGFASLVPRAGLSPVIDVPVITLEEAAQRTGAVPHLVKMDVEGAELEILEAARPWLRAERPALAIDTNHRVGGRFTDQRVEAILADCGYEVTTARVNGRRLTTAQPRDRLARASR